MIGERDFALLDLLVRQKPNARTITLEAIIMWMNNKTVKWLDGLDADTKSKYMEAARRHADTAIDHYNKRMEEIKRQKVTAETETEGREGEKGYI